MPDPGRGERLVLCSGADDVVPLETEAEGPVISHLFKTFDRRRRLVIILSVALAVASGFAALALARSEGEGGSPRGEPVNKIELFGPEAGGSGERRR